MTLAANLVVALVALLHFYFLVLEMFLWTRPLGLRVFGQTREAAEATRVLAANQGLYNGFLAAGLLWACTSANVGGPSRSFSSVASSSPACMARQQPAAGSSSCRRCRPPSAWACCCLHEPLNLRFIAA
jgi:hypothetical protein